MEMDREALKARLLKMAEQESLKLGTDVSQEMGKNYLHWDGD